MLHQTNNITNYLYLYVIQSNPTKEEIQHTIQLVSKRFPKLNPVKIFQALYRKVNQLKKKRGGFNQGQVVSISQSKCYDYNNFIKKMIAKSFYYLGYGYQRFIHFMIKQHASFHIDKNRYNIFCQGMVLQIYRSLEKTMIRNGEKIKMKHKDAVRELNIWVLNYSMYLSEENTSLLKAFISRRYDIKDNSFTIIQAKRLYQALQKRYDPSMNMQIEMMDDFLNNIQLHSDNDESPQFNLEQLLDHNDFPYQNNIPNKKVFSNPNQNQLHFYNWNGDQLNFDIESEQYN